MEHTSDCSCPACNWVRENMNYPANNSNDNVLAMLATLFDELDLNSFTIAGRRGNHWTIRDSRG